MEKRVNDCVIEVATVNGSGSQSANNILMRTIFRMGVPVGGKNLFPSNIAGLPTWFTIRANKDGFTARREEVDIIVAMNPQTIGDDIKKVKKGGVFIYNSDLKVDPILLRQDVTNVPLPFRELVDKTTDAIKLKKLLANMIFVGVLAELLGLDQAVLRQTVKDQFRGKEKAFEPNLKALDAGQEFARTHLANIGFGYSITPMKANDGKILIEGNTAGAMGVAFGGCTFVSWYPITPSSSLAENFISFAERYRKDAQGKNTFAVVQAEDELAAITMVAGAGWAGARAMTATSGPGISLMAECAGLMYYAEIPAVIWDIQRVGPSTGMPTRTAQGDITSAYNLSHGDTRHVVLLPGNAEECFEFGQTAFDLAERLQTLVFVLSDLDLGMNYWTSNAFKYPTKPLDRGKVLNADQLNSMQKYWRYEDVDGDAIPYRTLPGTKSDKAAFLTRGSGHNEAAQYTESSPQYQKVVDRLIRKFETARTLVPAPAIDEMPGAKVGIIAFGSSDAPMAEAREMLKAKGLTTSYLRLKALPLSPEVGEFIKKFERIYVVEQNRDGQMCDILRQDFYADAGKFRSIRHYDGLPIHALCIAPQILQLEKTGKMVATSHLDAKEMSL